MPDVIVCTKAIVAPGATGTQAYSMPTELGGRTPKAILVFAGGGAAANGAGGGSFVNICGGIAVNGGNTNAAMCTSDDNVTTVNTISEWSNTILATTAVAGAGNYRCSVSAWSANGFTLNWTTLAPFVFGMEFFVVIIAGNDAEVYTDVINLGTGTSAIDITAPNFQPDLVILMGSQTAAATDVNSNGAAFGIGFATATEQRCMVWGENDAIASGGQPAQHARNNAAWLGLDRSNGNAGYTCQVDTFDAQGFSITPSSSASSHIVSYIAIGLGGLGVKIIDTTTKTSTGLQAYTGAGFEPGFGMLVASNMAAYNTAYFNQVEAVGMSVSAFDVYGNEYSHGFFEDDTADPTNNGQWSQAVSLQVPSRTTPGASLATLDTLDADGFTLNYSASNGSARIAFALLIETWIVPTAFASRRFFM